MFLLFAEMIQYYTLEICLGIRFAMFLSCLQIIFVSFLCIKFTKKKWRVFPHSFFFPFPLFFYCFFPFSPVFLFFFPFFTLLLLPLLPLQVHLGLYLSHSIFLQFLPFSIFPFHLSLLCAIHSH